ncbi:hypothetical protein NDU88_004091 [Pleurodeles waltl]|uniref:Secreted protein n=1 Tax=Pleurodeles waltl TaxID=8319 RepID=A0AAV7RKC0_PLEWA|nr:hypothetical protein NDU88_004091 [Pleurodeles waltl]
MVWAYFCWRDGGGLVFASLTLAVGVADFCGCRVFGGLPLEGQNDRGGLPQPRQCCGGLLIGGKRLLPPRKKGKGFDLHSPKCGGGALIPFPSSTIFTSLVWCYVN